MSSHICCDLEELLISTPAGNLCGIASSAFRMEGLVSSASARHAISCATAAGDKTL